MLKLTKNILCKLSVFLIFLSSCISGGTHGSIKTYEYPISKNILQVAAEKIIEKMPNIKRDNSKSWNDSTKADYYDDGVNYVSITITKGDFTNKYTFKYAGDKEYWDTSKISNIFIAYAYDRNGNGGSEGNGGIKNDKLKDDLIKIFETEFIQKLDSSLKLTRIDIQ